MNGFFTCVAIVSAFILGYAQAHYVVAIECKKLGRFYVDDEVFECIKITSKNRKEEQ